MKNLPNYLNQRQINQLCNADLQHKDWHKAARAHVTVGQCEHAQACMKDPAYIEAARERV